MKRFYYILLTLLSVAVLSWVLPWLASFCFPNKTADPFVSWSPVSDSFIVSIPNKASADDPDIYEYNAETESLDRKFTRDQRDSLLPEMYVNQLAAKRLMPDSIKGVEMSMPNIRRNRWVFTSQPRNINRSVPTVYPLIESMPARFDLEDPKVVLTMPGRVEIIDIASNSIDSVKTRRFARMFRDKGFTFPAREASANITTRKGYDNGYLIIDGAGQLYHLKMQVSRPSMARIELPEGCEPTHVWVLENPDKMLYGLVSSEDGSLWALEHEDYKLVKLPGVTFDPETQRGTIMKTLFSWVIKTNDDKSSTWVALDARDPQYGILGEYTYRYETSGLASIEKWIFPFTISFTSPNDLHVYPRIEGYSWNALVLGLILAIIFMAMKRRDSNKPCLIARAALILVCGLYAFIPLILIKK